VRENQNRGKKDSKRDRRGKERRELEKKERENWGRKKE